MNPFYEACYLYRRREYQQCVDLCTTFLSKNPLDQVISIRIYSSSLHCLDETFYASVEQVCSY